MRLRERFVEDCGETDLTAERIWNLHPRVRKWLKVERPDMLAPRSRRGPKREVSLRQVQRFLECPLQGWARLELGLAEDEDDDQAAREDEPFATDRLSTMAMLREVLGEALARECLDGGWPALEPLYEVRAAALARAGKMPVGLFRHAERRRHRECLSTWAASAQERELLRHGPFRVRRFGRAAENERVDDLGPPLEFAVPLRGSDGATRTETVRLYGRTGYVSTTLPGSVTGVARDRVQHKDFLSGFLDALVASLIEKRDWAEFDVHVLTASGGPSGKLPRRLRAIEQEPARSYLTEILAEMLGERHAYLLPCEAVFEHLTKDKTIAGCVESLVEDDRASCSSRWGPVPDFGRYEPPDDETARALIERRFGLFRKCGGLGE
jgi:exodeoxyribonuclease V gamma subunit